MLFDEETAEGNEGNKEVGRRAYAGCQKKADEGGNRHMHAGHAISAVVDFLHGVEHASHKCSIFILSPFCWNNTWYKHKKYALSNKKHKPAKDDVNGLFYGGDGDYYGTNKDIIDEVVDDDPDRPEGYVVIELDFEAACFEKIIVALCPEKNLISTNDNNSKE